MTEDYLISVIVPAYNAENSIAKCIRSIQNQTYRRIEIIIINDGSKDSTQDIVEDFQKQDKRIILINKNNEGVSRARNDGLNVAQGRFVVFADSDDYFADEMIFKLYNAKMLNKCDLVVCGFNNVFANDRLIESSFHKQDKKLNIQEYLLEMSECLYSVYYGALWNKLYDMNIISAHKIRFDNEISYAEDFIFNTKYLNEINSVIVISDILYNYNHQNESSLTQKSNAWEVWETAKLRLNLFIKLCQKFEIYDKCREKIYMAVAEETIGPTYYVMKDSQIQKKEAKKKLEEIYKDKIIAEAVKKTQRPVMVHRIARLSYRFRSYEIFYLLMKAWIAIRKNS